MNTRKEKKSLGRHNKSKHGLKKNCIKGSIRQGSEEVIRAKDMATVDQEKRRIDGGMVL